MSVAHGKFAALDAVACADHFSVGFTPVKIGVEVRVASGLGGII